MDCTPKNLRDHIPTVYVCQSLPKDPDQPEGGCTRLFEDVGAGAEEFEEAEVAQDLELLAGFVADGAKGRGKGQKPRPLNRRLRHPVQRRDDYETPTPRAAALKMAKVAPCGSAMTEMRPTSSKSVGGR